MSSNVDFETLQRDLFDNKVQRKSGLNPGAIAGIVIAVLVIIALIILLVVFLTPGVISSSSIPVIRSGSEPIRSGSAIVSSSIQSPLLLPDDFSIVYGAPVGIVQLNSTPAPGAQINSVTSVLTVNGVEYENSDPCQLLLGRYICFFQYPELVNLPQGTELLFKITASNNRESQTFDYDTTL